MEEQFENNYSESCLTNDGMKYLKVRTLVDTESLKRSSRLKAALAKKGIQYSAVNRKEILSIRRQLFSQIGNHNELDDIIRIVFSQLFGDINHDSLKQALTQVATNGDEYWAGWNSVYRDDIRAHIQHNFVREPSITDLRSLLRKIDAELSPVVKGYTVISWYNQWSSTIIERIFQTHARVVPTVRRIDKVDFFLRNIPIDLKMTFLPEQFIRQAKRNLGARDDSAVIDIVRDQPLVLAKWLYENQGEFRFSDSNRLFIVLMDENDLSQSWKLKSDFELIESDARKYLESNDTLPSVEWDYEGDRISGHYRTHSDVLLIAR